MRWLDDDRKAGIAFLAGLGIALAFAVAKLVGAAVELDTGWALLIVAMLGLPIIARNERRLRDRRPHEDDPRLPGDHDLLSGDHPPVDRRQNDVT